MPYKSLRQARKFHFDPKLRRYAAEYDRATDFSKLPERAKKKRKHGSGSVLYQLHRRGR